MGLRHRANAYSLPQMIVVEDYHYYISGALGFRILAMAFGMFFHNVGIDYLSEQQYTANNFIHSPWPGEVLNGVFSGHRFENDYQKWILGLMEAMTSGGARLTHSHVYEHPMTFQFIRPRSWTSIFVERANRLRIDRMIICTYPDVYYQQITSQIFLRYAPFVAIASGNRTYGITWPNGKQIAPPGRAGPTMDQDYPTSITAGNDWVYASDQDHWNEKIIFGTNNFEILSPQTGLNPGQSLAAGEIAMIWPWHRRPDGNLPDNANLEAEWFINMNVIPRIMFENCMPLSMVSGLANANQVKLIQRGSGTAVLPVWIFGMFSSCGVSSIQIYGSQKAMNRMKAMLKHTSGGSKDKSGKIPDGKKLPSPPKLDAKDDKDVTEQ